MAAPGLFMTPAPPARGGPSSPRLGFENFSGESRGAIAADQHLHGLLADFLAYAADLAFGDDVSVGEEDHLVRNHVDFVQDVTGDDQVAPFGGVLAKQRDGFGADQR